MLPDGYLIREVEPSDADALCAALVRNREHLSPWEPTRPESYFTPGGQEDDVRARFGARAAGLGGTWVVVHQDDIVGRVTVSNVARGPFQSCNLGYWVDQAHTGRGLATAAVTAACDAARAWGLHRVEAGTLPDNPASQAVLIKCGFAEFGLAPEYLLIAGEWRDHRLFQRILHRSSVVQHPTA